MSSGRNANQGTCAVMKETRCCSRCAGTAPGPPAKGRQSKQRAEGVPGAARTSGEVGGGAWASTRPGWRDPIEPNIRVLRASLYVVPLLCGLFASIDKCHSLDYCNSVQTCFTALPLMIKCETICYAWLRLIVAKPFGPNQALVHLVT